MRASRPPRRRLRAVLIFSLVLSIGAYVFTRATARKAGLRPRTGTRGPDDEVAYRRTWDFWARATADDQGVTGGYAHISKHDTQSTLAFIRKLMNLPDGEPTQRLVAIDCGAGVGRVTKGALVHAFTEIDLLEQNPKMLEAAQESLKEWAGTRTLNFVNQGMHEFVIAPERYDFALMNWSMGYLNDEDAADFLHRLRLALRPGGHVVVKDNLSTSHFVDGKDEQRVRTDKELKAMFAKAGFKLLAEQMQDGMPAEIVAVKMYGLAPAPPGELEVEGAAAPA